ncbi:MAG: rRNA maturation RNase YbeY [Planctomycetota bacterium]
MKLEVFATGDVLAASGDTARRATRLIETQLPRAAALLDHAPAAVEVQIIGDATMSRLHEQFLGIEGPTDVLTFELDYDTGGRVTESSIAVCLDEAARQAATRSHDTATELLLYAVHGLLHLVGYDDHDPDDYAAMHAKEDEILTALGVGRVFDD